MKHVRVAADRWNFVLAGTEQIIVPLGGNMVNDEHPVHGTIFRHFDVQDCDRRLGLMADLGLNCLRQAIGVNEVFDPQSGLKAAGLKNWDTFIALAEKHGIYLMPVGGYLGGNDWFDVSRLADSGRCLDESCAFWEAFVGHYAGHPAIWAWDLRNELLYDEQDHMTVGNPSLHGTVGKMLKEGWPQWLKTRYGSLAAL
ncbi:MAG: hypothetical protein WCI73_18755, partial [Phycisphaerae bacterium]